MSRGGDLSRAILEAVRRPDFFNIGDGSTNDLQIFSSKLIHRANLLESVIRNSDAEKEDGGKSVVDLCKAFINLCRFLGESSNSIDVEYAARTWEAALVKAEKSKRSKFGALKLGLGGGPTDWVQLRGCLAGLARQMLSMARTLVR